MFPHFIMQGRAWLLLAGLIVLGGCGKEKEKGPGAPVENPFAGLAIEIAVPADRNLPTDWRLPVNEWSVQHGAEAKLQEYQWPEDSAEFPAVLIEAAGGAGKAPEVLLIPWSAVPELAAEEGLAEIPEAVRHQEQLNWLGFFTGLRNRVARIARKPRLVPVSCPVLVCYYREDLLKAARLSPPRTWSEYQTLLETLDDWAPGLTAVEPWEEAFRATMFLARSAAVAKHPEQYSFCFEFRTGEPLIANPGFAASLDLARAALARMPAEVKNYSPADCRREILEGRAAIAIAYETDLNQNVQRGESLEIGIGPLPGSTRVFNTAIDEWVEFDPENVHRVTLTGFSGWALAVSAGLEPTMNHAAWELTRYMAVDQLPTSYPASMISLCRDSQTANPARWTGPQLTTAEAEQYVSVVAESLRSDQIVMEFPLIGNTRFRTALTKGLTAALGEETDSEAILKSVAEDWRAISEELGKEKVAKSYQRSHE